ncbi:MAG: hypothetical protein K0R98_863 [Rickettsiaceae bacterium]|nr:hypothetical protein [Rickettsiaceae bacterium]
MATACIATPTAVDNTTSRAYKRLYEDAQRKKYGFYPKYDPDADNFYPTNRHYPNPNGKYQQKYPYYDADADNPCQQKPFNIADLYGMPCLDPSKQFHRPLFTE